MGIITCISCGAVIDDRMSYCPNCGQKILTPQNQQMHTQNNNRIPPQQPRPNTNYQYGTTPQPQNYGYAPAPPYTANTKKHDSTLSIIAAVLAIFIITTPIAFILGLIDLGIAHGGNGKKNERHLGSWFAIVMFILVMIVFSIEKDDSKTETSNKTSTEITSIKKDTPISITVDEQIIHDDNNVIIKVMSCEENYKGFTINLYIENNSNKNYSFCAHSYAVNGVMTHNNIYDMDCDVVSGKKANTKLTIDEDFLEEYNIDCVKYVKVLFGAYDNDKGMKDFETEQIKIKTNKYDDTKYSKIGRNVLDTDNMSIDYLYNNGNTYYFALTNKSKKYFDFDISNLSINDYTVSDIDYDLYDKQVLGKCQFILAIKVDDDFLDMNNIDTVNKFDFNITYRPLGDYFNEKQTDMISITDL